MLSLQRWVCKERSMDAALVIATLTIGAAIGSIVTYAIIRDRRPIIDQFREMHHSAENIEQRARRIQ